MINLEAVTAWSTFALAAFAGLALFVALGQIREARALRRATHRAYVAVHVEGDKGTLALNLVLENTGLSTAKNVKVEFNPPLQAAHPSIDHASSQAVWSQPTMPPRRVIRTVLDHGPDRSRSALPLVFDATVCYDSPATKEVAITELYTIDLEASAYAVRQWDLVDQETPKQSKALESIAESLKKMTEE